MEQLRDLILRPVVVDRTEDELLGDLGEGAKRRRVRVSLRVGHELPERGVTAAAAVETAPEAVAVEEVEVQQALVELHDAEVSQQIQLIVVIGLLHGRVAVQNKIGLNDA